MDMCVVHVVTSHCNNSLEQQYFKRFTPLIGLFSPKNANRTFLTKTLIFDSTLLNSWQCLWDITQATKT